MGNSTLFCFKSNNRNNVCKVFFVVALTYPKKCFWKYIWRQEACSFTENKSFANIFECKCSTATFWSCRTRTLYFCKTFIGVSVCCFISCGENYILYFFFSLFPKGEHQNIFSPLKNVFGRIVALWKRNFRHFFKRISEN